MLLLIGTTSFNIGKYGVNIIQLKIQKPANNWFYKIQIYKNKGAIIKFFSGKRYCIYPGNLPSKGNDEEMGGLDFRN